MYIRNTYFFISICHIFIRKEQRRSCIYKEISLYTRNRDYVKRIDARLENSITEHRKLVIKINGTILSKKYREN